MQDTELQQEVKVVNSGGDELPFTVALHSYFRVGDITQVRGTGCGCMGCFWLRTGFGACLWEGFQHRLRGTAAAHSGGEPNAWPGAPACALLCLRPASISGLPNVASQATGLRFGSA